jgi:8-oxo-dGTP pyrophosphatase MutT (NUDIX family)
VRLPHEALIGVVRGGEILVLYRTKERYWHLVAGAVEPGETAAEAAKRELWEETGLVADPTDLGWRFTYPLGEEPHRLPHFAPGTEEIVVEVFSVAAPSGWEPTLNEEHERYRWAGLAEATELLRWPEPRELAVRLLSQDGEE